MNTITLRIEQDGDCANPLTDCDGMWTLYRFHEAHRNGDTSRSDFFERRKDEYIPHTLDLFFKLRNGLAFTVHSCGDEWHADAHDMDGFEGVLIWENKHEDMGAKTYDERYADAQSTLRAYNLWASGECYGWVINDGQKNEDSCWGFIGEEHLIESLKCDWLPDERPLRVVTLDRETERMIDHFGLGDDVEVMTRIEFERWNREQDAYETGDEEAA